MKSLRRSINMPALRAVAIWTAAAMVVLIVTPQAAPLWGQEAALKKLEELRASKKFDEALEFLRKQQANGDTPESFREVINYERGVTLAAAAEQQQDLAARDKQLVAAQQAFDDFITQQPTHRQRFEAKSRIGQLTVERARLKWKQAKQAPESARQEPAEAAKELYAQAYQSLRTLQGEIRDKLATAPKLLDQNKDFALIQERDLLRANYLQALLLAAASLEESADVRDKSAPDHRETLAQAADEYREVYEKYRTRLAGSYARMYQGRALQKQEKFAEALDCYEEVLKLPYEQSEYRALKTKTLVLALESWFDDSQRKYAEGIKRGHEWLDKATREELPSDSFLELRLVLARGSLLYVAALKKKDTADPQIKQLLTEARDLAQYVADQSGARQQEAKQFLAKLPAP